MTTLKYLPIRLTESGWSGANEAVTVLGADEGYVDIGPFAEKNDTTAKKAAGVVAGVARDMGWYVAGVEFGDRRLILHREVQG